MQRRTPPANRTAVLDIIDDERAGVNQLDGFGTRAVAPCRRHRQGPIAAHKTIAKRNQLGPDALARIRSEIRYRTKQNVHENGFNRRSGVEAKQFRQVTIVGDRMSVAVNWAALGPLLGGFFARLKRSTRALKDRIFHASLLELFGKSDLLVNKTSGTTRSALAIRTRMSIETFCFPPSTATMQTRVTRAALASSSWVQPSFVRSSRTRWPSVNKYSLSIAFGRSARRSFPMISMPSAASRAMMQPRWRLTGAALAAKIWPPRTRFVLGDTAVSSLTKRCT